MMHDTPLFRDMAGEIERLQDAARELEEMVSDAGHDRAMLIRERDALEYLACAMLDCLRADGWHEENVIAGMAKLRGGAATAPIELVNAVRRCAGLEERP